jgi:hypothetical protein
MEDNDLVVQADRYHALCAMEGRVNALVDLIRAKKELTTNDALIILGYEPESDNLTAEDLMDAELRERGKYAGESEE